MGMRFAALSLLFAGGAVLQAQATAVTVRGVAFDSLRNTTLGGAFVTINEGGKRRSTTADSTGRFSFDAVMPGTHIFSAQHAAVDSLGLPGITSRTTITNGVAEVTVAIPSFASLWSMACGPGKPPADSGFIYGVVRDAATQRPLGQASVDLSWVDLAMGENKAVTQRRWRNQTRTDDRGSYGVCGVPAGMAVRIQAINDTMASGVIELAPSDVRVMRRDLYVAPTGGASTVLRGTIVGTVMGSAGSPYRDARVTLEGVAEVRSGADGRFTIRDVPAGTRQLDISAIGMSPTSVIVDVVPNDTALVTATVGKVTTLDAVQVKALARQREFNRDLEERKKSGLGYMQDSTQMKNIGNMANVFATFPSAEVKRTRGSAFYITFPAGTSRCVGLVWIDGRRGDYDQLAMIQPADLALVEVYPSRLSVPLKFSVPGQFCGVIAVWTKYSLK
jgi:hypothetical protein